MIVQYIYKNPICLLFFLVILFETRKKSRSVKKRFGIRKEFLSVYCFASMPEAPAETSRLLLLALTTFAAASPVSLSLTDTYQTLRRPNQKSRVGVGFSTVAALPAAPPPHVSDPAAMVFSLVACATDLMAEHPVSISAATARQTASAMIWRLRSMVFAIF